MNDFDLLKDTPELTAAINQDRGKIMIEADKEIVEEIRPRHAVCDKIRKRGDAEILTDGEFEECHEDRAELLCIVDSQALEIERLKREAQKMRDSLHSNHDSEGEYWPKPEYSWEKT